MRNRSKSLVIMSTKVLQINLHHCKLATSSLADHLARHHEDIVLIQEPWIDGKSNICGLNIKGYNICYKNGNYKPRTCILIKSHLRFFLVDAISNGDLTAIVIEHDNNNTQCIASGYLPSDEGNFPSQQFKQLSEQRRWPTVIGCDANAHNVVWGSSDTNSRGECLFNFILENDLKIRNRGCTPTFSNKVREEVLDLTLTTQTFNDEILNWRVLEEDSFSDHKYISFEISSPIGEDIPRRNPRKTDWKTFEEKVGNFFSDKTIPVVGTAKELDNLAELVSAKLREFFEVACPLPRQRKGKSYPHWWTKEIGDLMKATRQLRKVTKNPYLSEIDFHSKWGEYVASKNSLKTLIRKEKRNSWKNFCEDIVSTNEASRLRKVLSKSAYTPTYIKRADSSYTESSKEVLDLLLETHFPGSTPELERAEPICTHPILNTSEPTHCRSFTKEEAKWAINSFQPYKAPGPDGIFPALLQHAWTHCWEWFLLLINKSISLGHTPEGWRKVNVVFIPKAGKINHNTAKDFRPISLSSFFLKTAERLVDMEIRTNLDMRKISKAQHAYQKGKSTETALHDVVGNIEDSISNKEFALVSFLDIEGAFNNVTTEAIVESLEAQGINHALKKWIVNMLSSRLVYSQLGNYSTCRTTRRGTPQGGVISPLLWVLVVNDLLLRLEEKRIKSVAYADDICVIIKGKFVNTLSDLMGSTLTFMKAWASPRGLNVNAAKTEIVLFTDKNKTTADNQTSDSVTVDGLHIPFSEKAKYLGIILDRKLNWNLNLDERIRKAQVAWYTCKGCIGKKWGINPTITKWIYTAVVRPILSYGILVWWHCTKKVTATSKLQKLQRSVCIGITGALRSTPTMALEVITNLCPLNLLFKEEAARCAMRLKNLGYFRSSSVGHRSILEDIKVESPSAFDSITCRLSFNKSFSTHIPSREDWDMNAVVSADNLEIYTDGSKTKEGTGSGVYCQELDINYSAKLPSECTVFQAEVLAIKVAASSILTKSITNRVISIYVDSQAAIKALEGICTRSSLVLNTIEYLNSLGQSNCVRICWVPGHNNHAGNEKADELAREGSSTTTLATEEVRPPFTWYKTSVKGESNKVWETEWTNTDTCGTSKMFWPHLNPKKSRDILKYPRETLRTLVGYLTGHCLLGKHARYMGITTNDECRFCDDISAVEDVIHIVCECQALRERRQRILGKFFLQEGDLHLIGTRDLLKFFKIISI